MSSEDSVTATTTAATSTMTTPLDRRDDPEAPPPPPLPTTPLAPPLSSSAHAANSHHTVVKTVRKHKKHVHTSHGTFIWIDGKKIRSALTYKKWPPRPKSVTFPTNDNDLVTGYLEPDNPWKLAENVKIEDLISSYKISCERHCTEPLQNVIAQLEKLDISDDERCSELCLRNEILEQKRCEPLEEIFKRVQFEKIDVEASSLDDESAVTLFDMFEYYESVTHLDLSNNRDIGARGWQACAHMIKKTLCLDTLEARNITLTQQHMNILKRPLQLVSHLHVLKLENCGLAGRAFVILVSALKMNTGLKELYLADNGLEQEDAIQLGALLRVNNHLQLLDISNNHIEDEGVRDILDGLITQSSEQRAGRGLGILVLWNNDLTKHSSGHFTQTIAESVTLETLNIGKNSVSNELLEMAREALIKSRTLLQLGMQSTNITCKGALALADIIERNQSLQRIDLRDNNIQMTGLTALSFAMKKNTSITQMDLDDKPWSKTPATMHQYLDLVSAIRGYCARNDEPTSTESSTEESSSSQHRSRLSSVSSRKISLTCQTLPRSSPSMTPTMNETRSMLEPNSTSGGRLRSPAPSPIPSPVASPIPSPSRSRFVVSRVSEASLTLPNLSASSSPVAPSSLASSPTCFFTSADGSSSRFRVVTVTEPGSESPIEKSVVTLPSSNVTIGFNYNVRGPNTAAHDDSSTFESANSNVREDRRPTGTQPSAVSDVDVGSQRKIKKLPDGDKADDRAKDIDAEINEATLINTKANERVHPEYADISVTENDLTGGVKVRRFDDEAPTASTSDSPEIAVAKTFDQPEIAATRANDNVDGRIVETESISIHKTEELFRNARIASFQCETKKPDPVQRQATSLERLLNLFQHPSSLFTGGSFADGPETKNPLQDGVNSMIALGDKFHQYFRESAVSGKSEMENAPSHGSLQRSVSDASRSNVKIDHVKSPSIPQLSSIRAIRTADSSVRVGGDDFFDDSRKNRRTRDKTDVSVIEERPSRESTKIDDDNDDVSKTIDDLPLPETSRITATNDPEEVRSTANVASTDVSGIPQLRWDFAPEIVNSATLNVGSDSRTAKCAQKLTEIPECSVAETKTTNADIDEDGNVSSRNDDSRVRTDNYLETKCDSSTKNSINDHSCKKSSLSSVVTCDISGVEYVHTSRITDDVRDILIPTFSNDDRTIVDASEDCSVILISSSEADESTTATAFETIREIVNCETNYVEHFSSRCSDVTGETALSSGAKESKDSTSNEVDGESSRILDDSTRGATTVTNNVDLSSSPLNDSSTIGSIDANGENVRNERWSVAKFDDPEITDEDERLPDTVEECLPIDVAAVAAAPAQLAAAQKFDAAIMLTDNGINVKSYPVETMTVTEVGLNIVVSDVREDKDSSRLAKDSAVISVSAPKISSNDEIVVKPPTMISAQSLSSPNSIFATIKEDAIDRQPGSVDNDDFVEISPIEPISNWSCGDSDSTGKLSVDDVRTDELSSNASTANSPANNSGKPIYEDAPMTDDSLDIIDLQGQESSARMTEHRSFVRAAIESVSTSIVNVSDSSTEISISKIKTNEFPNDLGSKKTNVTIDESVNANEVANRIVTTIQECEESGNLEYFLSAQTSKSTTNLYIEKSRTVHSNSQDSGIEEATVLSSDDNVYEGNGRTRESFQESVDSGIDSEGSSVCARVEVGADVQKERARDPGKSTIVDAAVTDGIINFSTPSATDDEISTTIGAIAKITESTEKIEIEDDNCSTRTAETLIVARNNEATTD